MNWLDILIVIALVISVFTGMKTGLIKAAFSLAGIIIGIILAGRFYTSLADKLTFIPQELIAQGVAFAIILIVVMVVFGILAGILTWITSAAMLGWVNRLGGALLGLLMGALSWSVLLAIWVKFFGEAQVVSHSAMAAFLLDHFPIVLGLLPGEFDAIRSFFQ
ncbi:MAG: CvpA family protein [Chloroflexota bacterium]